MIVGCSCGAVERARDRTKSIEWDKGMKTPIAYWQRHVGAITKYGSPQKLANLLRAYYHYRRGSARIPSMPCFLKVEISRKCGMDCKLCPGKADDKFYDKTRNDDVFYDFEAYKELVDRLKDYVFVMSLYDIGEPLQNPEALKYIRYAHENRMGTVISSSLSLTRSDEFWRELATSGLDRLIVAIDGTTQDIYSKYRTNGNLQLVMANLAKILQYKTEARKPLRVEWQMLDMPHNKCEQAAARSISREMNCDQFRLIAEAYIPRWKYKEQDIRRDHNCLLPYIIFIVNAHNRVRPCYKVYDAPMTVGDLSCNTFEEIWNSDEMACIRDRQRITERVGCMTCQE